MPSATCHNGYNERVASAYASYARFVTRFGVGTLLLGVTLAVIACVGLLEVETTNDVLNFWMYKGTRLDGEKDYYEKYFGGDMRTESVVVSADDEGNVATTLGLDAMLEATQVFIVGGEDGVTYDMEVNGTTETFESSDVCLSPPVPTAMLPYSTEDDPDTGLPSWLLQEAFISYGYRHVSLCMKNGTGSLPVPEEDLEYGWGIDRLPCTRLSALDCFQEGNYDYPDAMKQLDVVSTFVALNNDTKKAECLDELGAELQVMLEVATNSSAQATAISTAITTQLESTIWAYWSWGYHWRKPYTGMTEEEIFTHISEAKDFAESGEDPATTCISMGSACCLSWAGTKLDPNFLFADVDDDAQSIKHLMTTQANFPINHPAWASYMKEFDIMDEEGREDVALGWESNFLDAMAPRFEKEEGSGYAEGETYEDIDIDYFSERSGNDMVESGNKPEAYLIWIAYAGMLVFAAFAMGSWDFSAPRSMGIYSRVLLSLGGMVLIALSTGACLGFISVVGVKLTPLSVVVVPFLSLGIGIDDMFIFIYTMVLVTGTPNDPKKRLEIALIHAGPSVVITSIANAACFLMAASVSITTVRNFALHMGLQMLFHLILFHLILVPMMYWDAVRVKNRRLDLAPFIKLSEDGIIPEQEFTNSRATKWFVDHVYSVILRSRLFKALAIACMLVMTAVLTWYGVTENVIGVSLSAVAEEGSHEGSFLEIVEESFTADICSLVTKEVDLGTYQQTLLNVQDAVEEVKWVSDVAKVKDGSWLANSSMSLLGVNSTLVEEEDFNEAFATWIQGTGIIQANNFYCADGTDGPRVDCTEFDPETTVIKASKIRVYLRDQGSTDEKVHMFNDMRDAVDGKDPDRDTFAYSDTFAVNSQYLYLWEMFFSVVAGGAVVVTAVILLLQGSWTVSLLIALCIIAVVLQVFGFFAVIEVGINGFSVVNLCVVVGLVVEFTAHIGRGFLFAPGGDRDERVRQTLSELLWPSCAGVITTFLAVLPLTFSKMSFFHKYFFQTFAIMAALSFFFGICILPVLLSIVGPPSMHLHKHTWDGQISSDVTAPTKTAGESEAPVNAGAGKAVRA